MKVYGHEEKTVSTANVGIGANIDAADMGGMQAMIQVDPVTNQSVRMWPDPGTPLCSSTSGFVLQPGDSMTFDLEIDKLVFTRQGAVDAKLNIMYFKL